MSRPFKDIQDAIIERIADDTDLVGLTCISQDKGDIDTQIEQAVAGAESGIFVIVEIMKGTNKDTLAKLDVEVILTVEEYVLINRAQPSPLTWDYVVVGLLTLFGTPIGNANQPQIINPTGFEVLSDTGGVMRAQITAKTNVQWKRI